MLLELAIFIITAATIFAYVQEKIKIEIIATTLITSLMILFYILGYDQSKLLSAFSNPALITIIGMLAISHAITCNNSFRTINKIVLSNKNQYPITTISILLLLSFVCSIFLNNTPVVGIFIPIMSMAATNFNIPNSKVMIPLAFTTSLGSFISTISSSTNMLIHSKLSNLGYQIDTFDFILPGIITTSIALVYTVFILPKILPSLKPIADDVLVEKFITKITIPPASKVIGKTVSSVVDINDSITLKRNGKYYYNLNKKILAVNDVIFVRTTREALSHLLHNNAGLIIANTQYTNKAGKVTEDLVIKELITPPYSYMVGKKLEHIAHYSNTQICAIGIQRAEKIVHKNLNKITLKAGDRILLIGKKTSISKFINKYQFMITDAKPLHIPKYTKAWVINSVFISVIGLTIFKILPIMINSILGVTILLLTKSITIKQLTESFQLKIFLVITSAYMLSVALESSSAILYCITAISPLLNVMHPLLMVAIIFIAITLLNEIMSNNAVGLIFTPIVVKIAENTNADPKLFIWALFFASNCAFATPISYQSNLLVMGPGNYKFKHYYKVGIPLTTLICFTYITFAYFYFV